MAQEKKRLDARLLEEYPEWSRTQLQSWILQGKVQVDKEVITKAGTIVGPDAEIVLNIEVPKYVSRGGLKLEKALEHFALSIDGFVALDAGISTGGFTDCLLQHGAIKVYGIDVGYGQVHEKLRADPRVIVKEKVNLRTLEWMHQPVDIVTLDLSFISITKVIPAVLSALKAGGYIVALIKPQFEAGRHEIGAKGLVKNPETHHKVQEKIIAAFKEVGVECLGIIDSPILGASSGNKEFLGCFIKR